MEIISIEKKTFEELVLRLGQFVKRMDSINRQRGGRRMSDWMCAKVLLNSADIGYLLQVAVHILIARNGQ